MNNTRKDVPSYFDLPLRRRTPSSEASTSISPSTAVSNIRRTPRRPPLVQESHRTQSDFGAVLKRNRVQVIDELLPAEIEPRPASAPQPEMFRSEEGHEQSGTEGYLECELQACRRGPHSISGTSSSDAGFQIPKESRSISLRRPHWIRTSSGNAWLHQKTSSSFETDGTNNSLRKTPETPTLTIRTEQTPLKPPVPQRVASSQRQRSSIVVETPFSEQNQNAQGTGIISEPTVDSSSRKSSLNPRRLFSAPLQLVQKIIHTRGQDKQTQTPFESPSPISRHSTRLEDHATTMKMHYTSNTLKRVSAVLHDLAKQSTKVNQSNSSEGPSPLLKPLRSRTLSDKSATQKARRSPRTTQGIVSQSTIYQQQKSIEHFPDFASDTSSQLNLRMGIQPTNTPEEQATYKVKRRASAETEEFMKIDISVRGKTSYLPSEARRIHTPPLPEEGADGRWRGFFFDYNAPQSTPYLPMSGHITNGSESSATNEGEGLSRTSSLPKGLGRTKSNRIKRVVSGDWFDVKLQQVDVGQDPSRIIEPKCGEKRLNSPGLFKASFQGHDEKHCDVTIPEHLPSSPLCPRHPRYWRVVKNKGSHFRGC
ncbi:uncharacterized protein PV06_00902 [Exophiala oligosperma]|uniref:Uncharacterized protein n=2 Tax=Chaetothyriales TaxID=34395 RepID=A0A0D2E0G3_9EURO|nr:uncharacterized protein PV06_00902 [Exophiala oligosperma]KAJ9618831.1 hypothetical protein H2204_012907 [Knufia peltigerae]KIW48300.1 hypothetical protein PV06_00902 [Exophiala oligosperma]